MAAANSREQRYRTIRAVTAIGALINVLLSALKIIFGFVAQSHALIADGAHSLSDLASDLMVVLAARLGSRDADEEHPYGHGRIETAFTVALGGFLVLVATGFIVDAAHRVLNPDLLLHPAPVALFVAALSILAKELLYRYTVRAANRVRSGLLRANAWHHRSDAISSVIVLAGVAGALLGFDYLDAFASVGVALMIARIGWDLAWNAIQELVDTGLKPERLERIRTAIMQVEGVKNLHMLRTRRMGGDALVDVHVQVDPRLSVSEGHQIGEYVRNTLIGEFDEVADVTVHVDPEDDAASTLCEGLPLRRELIGRLYELWRPILDPAQIQAVNLHYLSGRIHVELMLPLVLAPEPQQAMALTDKLCRTGEKIDEVGKIQVYFKYLK